VSAPFSFEALADSHDRAAFACGEEPLDRYFQSQVTQDIRRKVTNCFVAVEAASGRIAAYYTLAASSIPALDLPSEIIRKLPRYPSIPAVRVGRLAVDLRFQSRSLGAALIADAARRTLSAAPAVIALLVDAKNDKAVAFYRHLGFLPFTSQPRTLLLPLATLAKTLFPPLAKK
jgi:ribosomal protein S18 acetylase RimI-like enzyme